MIPLKEDHTLTIDPRIWQRLGEIAVRHYEGSRSKAVEGLALHEWLVEVARKRDNDHWISAPLVLNPAELEPLLQRLLAGDCDYVGSWMSARLEELARRIIEREMPRLPGL